jgi:hypothetical protein
MNLICFPHYTCGGLLTDIFNQTFSEVAPNGGINSINDRLGKIGDSDTVFDQYNTEEFDLAISYLQTVVKKDEWVATHCWPGIMDTSMFNQVLSVTTATYRSKLYRWMRACHHYYKKSDAWLAVSGLARIDKERETAKNYLKPFLPITVKNVVNIEFSEIVDTGPEFLNLVAGLEINSHIERWKSLNYFLYNNDIWNSTEFLRFYEAELETQLSKFYIYE